jgi:hypothetical protein
MPSVPSFRATSGTPQPADHAREGEPGGVLFRLRVPALAFPDYLGMQAALTGRHMPKAGIDAGLLWLGGIAIVGTGLIAASFLLGITSGLYVDVKAWEWSTHLGGGPLVIIVAAIAALAWFAATMRHQPAFLACASALHAEGRDLFGPQDLALTDEGIVCANGTGTHFVRWTAMSDLVLLDGIWYAVIGGGAAIWIPEETIRTSADPDGLRALLRDRIATAGPA